MVPSLLADSERMEMIRHRAEECEKRGSWLDACRLYEELLRKDRNNAQARVCLQRCQRRLQVAVRAADPLHRQLLNRLSLSQALDAYDQVLVMVMAVHADRSRTDAATLFQQGLQEVRLALEEPLFRQQYLSDVPATALETFRQRLADWTLRRPANRSEAREQVRLAIRWAGRDGLLLRGPLASALVLEFAAGACAGLDEYSGFLSGSLAGRLRTVGIGVDLGIVEGRLLITRVYPRSAAAEAGLLRGDQIHRIGAELVGHLPVDMVADRLRGEPGSFVDVEIQRAGEPARRMIRLMRRAGEVASVEARGLVLEDGTPAGYLRIHQFQDSTLHEVQEALLTLMGMGTSIKGLILDLRGNPGGLFKSALAVAELFLTEGVIVISQSPHRDYNRTFRVESGGPVLLPLVVLIDGDTASSAEVLAGALKEARAARLPTRLLGQPSNGKGSVQCIIPMDRAPLEGQAAIRLTVARLLSPTSQPYNRRGVTPHLLSDREGDALVEEAAQQLLELIHPGTVPGLLPRPMPTMDGEM
jgi:C-terminal peptidase prc